MFKTGAVAFERAREFLLDDSEAVSDRLGRISNTAQELIDTLERKFERLTKAGSNAGEAA